MKLLLSVVLFTLTFSAIYGWTAILHTLVYDTGAPDYCHDNKEWVGKMKFGEVKMKPGECEVVECSEKAMTFRGCDPVAVPAECKLVEDLSKPYPDCCPQVKC